MSTDTKLNLVNTKLVKGHIIKIFEMFQRFRFISKLNKYFTLINPEPYRRIRKFHFTLFGAKVE